MHKNYYFFLMALLCTAAGYSQCTPPDITGTAGPSGSICAGSSATLTASITGDGNLAWYNAATGGTQVGTGGTFETPSLSATTSFWVEAQSSGVPGAPVSGGGKTFPGNSASSVVAGTSPWGLVFNAYEGFILNSVQVFLASGSPGTLVIELKDSNFNVLETTTIATPAGGTASNPVPFTVPLDYTIAPGNGYRLVAVSSPTMIRDFSSGVAFPYPIGTLGAITQGTINNSNSNSGLYYFFYNWNFSPYSVCASEREEVVVNVTTIDLPTAGPQSFCGAATVSSLMAEGTALQWYSSLSGGSALSGTMPLSGGNYYVSQTIDGCESARTQVAVTVNPVPEAPEAMAQSFCGSGTVSSLMAGGSNLSWYAAETDEEALTGAEPLLTGMYYVSQTQNGCESLRTAVEVTINTTDIPGVQEMSFCDAAFAADLYADGENLQWYDSDAGGTPMPEDTPLVTGIYYVSQTLNDCESPLTEVAVTIHETPAIPDGEAMQDFVAGETIEDLEVEGENMAWYTDEELTNPVPVSTMLTNGAVYYVTATTNGCTSSALQVTVNEVLRAAGHELKSLTCYPNPASTYLNLDNATPIESINIYTLHGQKVLESKPGTTTAALDVSLLAAGSYIVKVAAGNAVQTIRIIKQ